MELTIKQALEREKALHRLLHKLKEQIADAVIREKPPEGVDILSETPCCATVKLSALDRMNLAPSTYLPRAQAAAVKRRLEPKQTVQSVLEELDEMVEKRTIRFSDGERVTLNENSVRLLSSYSRLREMS